MEPYLFKFTTDDASMTSFSNTSDLAELSMRTIRQTHSTILPLPEQQEIVRLLDEQFTAIEQNEKEITHSLTQSQALRQSILKKAFSGKLV